MSIVANKIPPAKLHKYSANGPAIVSTQSKVPLALAIRRVYSPKSPNNLVVASPPLALSMPQELAMVDAPSRDISPMYPPNNPRPRRDGRAASIGKLQGAKVPYMSKMDQNTSQSATKGALYAQSIRNARRWDNHRKGTSTTPIPSAKTSISKLRRANLASNPSRATPSR